MEAKTVIPRPAGRRGPAATAAKAAALAAAVLLLLSFAWPVDPVEIAATFGSDGEGSWVTGILFASEGGYALSVADGELLFWHEESNEPETLPSGLGSFVALDHGQDFTAVYARLKPGSITAEPLAKKAGDILAVAGSSGYSAKGNLLFSLYDRANSQYVNPLLILLPERDDPKPPSIRSVYLRDAKGELASLAAEPRLKQGAYELIAEVADQAEGAWSLGQPAPYSVRVMVNGSERIGAVYDLSKVVAGKRILFAPANRDYAGFYLGGSRISLGSLDLTRGKNLIELIVADAGTSPNQRSVRYAFQVY